LVVLCRRCAVLVPWLAVFDLRSLLGRFHPSLDLDAVEHRSDSFALLVPIFNDLSYLKNVDWLRSHGSRVVLCTTTVETPEFMEGIHRLAAEHGFRVATADLEVGSSNGTKNPWAIFSKSLFGHDVVLREGVSDIDEDFVVFLDGDTTVDGDLRVACGAMIENDLDLASVRVLPSRRETIIERLQGVEYDVAMDGRRAYPWLTSGAGMIASTSAMAHILQNHSMFFNGGDIEIGKLANAMGKRVGHVPMAFMTEVPSDFRAWVRQRTSWMCGAFRHCVVNVDHIMRYPGHFLYYFLLLYVLLPFKWYEIVTAWYVLPAVFALYVAVTFATNWDKRGWWLLLFPLYALFQATVIIWLGARRYFSYARRSSNAGRIRVSKLRRRNRSVIWANWRRTTVGYLLNGALITSVLLLVSHL
jgi:hypothetical protein